MKATARYGLLGQKLGHSWSKSFFTSKFDDLKIAASYENVALESADLISRALISEFDGLNVTVPYKESVIPLLDSLTESAKQIGAVNCIERKGTELIGHNTDALGFKSSLRPFLKQVHRKALILGTGGSSKAIAYVLDGLGIEYLFVSRTAGTGRVSYTDLNVGAMDIFKLIINCTPLGMYPNEAESPLIPYSHLGNEHFLYDLVYNPEETAFLRQGKENGAQVMNGHRMLIDQAEASWDIWRQD